ncbi:MAG: PAS domain-containing protein [Bacteroidetes bacterium]|nr:PAS domain-containing protein [Bacteroidota bacterium]
MKAYSLFMQAPIPICSFRGDKYVLEFANDYYLQILGKDESIIGKPIFESFPELIDQGFKEVIDGVLSSRKSLNINEYEFILTKNNINTVCYFNCVYQPIVEPDDSCKAVLVIFVDVTEMVIAKNANAKSQQKLSVDLDHANSELSYQREEKIKRATELDIANIELAYQDEEKGKRADELGIANIELAYQDDEKRKRAAELGIANEELEFQVKEKEKRAAELIIANQELVFQNNEKEKRAAELVIANKELIFQNKEKEKRAAELVIANKELVFKTTKKKNVLPS